MQAMAASAKLFQHLFRNTSTQNGYEYLVREGLKLSFQRVLNIKNVGCTVQLKRISMPGLHLYTLNVTTTSRLKLIFRESLRGA